MRGRPALIVAALLAASTLCASPLTEVYKRVQTAVVVIETAQKEIDAALPGQLTSVGGLGSGALISSDGKVLTAAPE